MSVQRKIFAMYRHRPTNVITELAIRVDAAGDDAQFAALLCNAAEEFAAKLTTEIASLSDYEMMICRACDIPANQPEDL